MVDKLANVKAFLVSVALDGFGSRRFIADESWLDEGHKYISEVACPGLYAAVMQDDPGYDPQGVATEAASDSAVKAFIDQLEAEKAVIARVAPGGRVWQMMYVPSQYGCFFEDLIAAMRADDPSYRPDTTPAPMGVTGAPEAVVVNGKSSIQGQKGRNNAG